MLAFFAAAHCRTKSKFHKHDNLTGFPLWRGKNRYIELWFMPRYSLLKDHMHREHTTTITILFGAITVSINRAESGDGLKRFNCLQWRKNFTIPSYLVHGAWTNFWPFIFLTTTKRVDGQPIRPKSAAEDIF